MTTFKQQIIHVVSVLQKKINSAKSLQSKLTSDYYGAKNKGRIEGLEIAVDVLREKMHFKLWKGVYEKKA